LRTIIGALSNRWNAVKTPRGTPSRFYQIISNPLKGIIEHRARTRTHAEPNETAFAIVRAEYRDFRQRFRVASSDSCRALSRDDCEYAIYLDHSMARRDRVAVFGRNIITGLSSEHARP